MPVRFSFFLFALLLAACFLFPGQGLAHKIKVFAWVSGNTVTVESGFAGNKPLRNGTITVSDNLTGAVLLQGTADAQGIFTFAVPEKAKAEAMDLLILVSGGEGHQNQWLVPAREYLPEQDLPAPPAVTSDDSRTLSATVDQAELKMMLEEILARELAPIKRSLAKAEENKPTVSDILGGIGYLIGLAGLAAWLKNRRSRKEQGK